MNSTIDPILQKQKEMLIVLTAMSFIEQNALITQAQLADARRSIQALFIKTTGEESMLRKLVEILKVNKELHEAFSSIAKISMSISASVEVIGRKINYLKHYVSRLQLTPQEHTEFFAPFLAFTHTFQEKTVRFNQVMNHYLEVREIEAKRTHEFRIAEEASKRLRERLSGELGSETQGEIEASMRQEVLGNFDYAGARQRLLDAERESRIAGKSINALLSEIRSMCQMAMNPGMRDQTSQSDAETYEDIFMRFTHALKASSRINQIKDFIIDYLRVYQRAYGLFVLDFDNFNKAVETITGNTDEYFESKKEDEDIKVKREKLKKYEGLIPFLENASSVVKEYSDYPFNRFSRKMSEIISDNGQVWGHIGEELLVAKVAAEAEITTRLSIDS